MGVNSLHWYYTPSSASIGEHVRLDGEEWHHCFHVMRMHPGDPIILANGEGLCMKGIIRSTGKNEGQIELTDDLSSLYQNPRSYQVCMGLAPTKNMDRTEFAVEKLVELGVDEICFLDCQNGERSHLRLERIQKILIAAAKQSRKIIFPRLHDMTKINAFLERKKVEPASRILACHMDENAVALSEKYLPGQDVTLLIGPEGGFSNEEIADFNNRQIQLVHLGPFRLRVETAAITACANIHLMNELKLKS